MVAWEERHLFFSGATTGRMFIYVLIHVPVNNSDETHVRARAHTDTRGHEHIGVSEGVSGIQKRVMEDEFVKNTSFCICMCVCMKMS